MKKLISILLLTLFVNVLSLTASSTIRFQFNPDAPIDSIKVENLDNQTSHTFTGGSELLFFFGAPTSVEKLIPLNDELRVSSSPNQREVNILFNKKTPGITTCEIFDVQGHLISSVNGNLKEESQSFTFIPDSKGVYLVRVTSGNTTRTAKFISYSTASVPSLFKNGTAKKAALKAPLLSYEIGRLVINQNDLLRIQCFSGTKSQTMYEYATSDKNYTIRFANRYHKFRLYNIVPSKPSFVDVMFAVTDASNRGVDDLNNTDFLVKEDGANISASESFRHVQQMNQVPFQIVLLIDNSISIVNDLQNIKESALQFVRKIRPLQQFAIYVFSDSPIMLQDFTNDTTKLKQSIEKIELGYPSTNLYGSVINALSKWTDEFSPTNFKQGALVLFTDGNDTQGSSTINHVISARGQKKVFVIGMGNEVTPSILNQISNPNDYIPISTSANLDSAFSQIQAEIVRFSNSFYWLNYMSPKRSGLHSLTVSTTGNSNSQLNSSITGDFSADGFQSVTSGVYVNISDIKLYGIDSIYCVYDGFNYNFTTTQNGNTISRDSIMLKPTTYWAFNQPKFTWEIDKPDLVTLNTENLNQIKLKVQPTESFEALLTIRDIGNNYTKNIILKLIPNYSVVFNPTTGKEWMDRNLGARRVATSSNDTEAYGDLYQWGRGTDGHEKRNSETTSTISSIDYPVHGKFIITNSGNIDWRSSQNDNLWQGLEGTNNPCPVGFRLPSIAELESERASWNSQNTTGAFDSPLKLPKAGFRHYIDGSLNNIGHCGYYWSSTITGTYAKNLDFCSTSAYTNNSHRAVGYSVRCIKKNNSDSLPIISTNSISNLTSNSVYSGGNISSDGGAQVLSRGVVWSTEPYPTISLNTKTTDGVGTGMFTSSITELDPSITYYLRAYASNSVGTAYGNQLSFTTTPITVTSHTGKTWMDRNLGARRVATSSNDTEAYGDLYQWGRGTDGHEKRTSQTSSSLSISDTPGHGNFITKNSSPYDWRSMQNNNLWQGENGINNPCPEGFRIPTVSEWELERNSWSYNNGTGAFQSPLKLPLGGSKDVNANLTNVGTYGYYWTSSVNGTGSQGFDFNSSNTYIYNRYRIYGFSVRCIKD